MASYDEAVRALTKPVDEENETRGDQAEAELFVNDIVYMAKLFAERDTTPPSEMLQQRATDGFYLQKFDVLKGSANQPRVQVDADHYIVVEFRNWHFLEGADKEEGIRAAIVKLGLKSLALDIKEWPNRVRVQVVWPRSVCLADLVRFEDTSFVARESRFSACKTCARPNAKLCQGCRAVSYCSAECQRTDWKAGHARECATSTQKL